jgi:peroxiredoxin
MALHIGDHAPAFSLYDSEKQLISLSDYEGKNLLILFFPLAFTGVCTKELCGMRDDIANYQHLGTEVVAISIDTPHTLKKFRDDNAFNFPLLSDFNKTTSTAYECIYEEFVLGMKGVSKRSAFVVDKQGIIKYAEVLETAGDVPNFDAIKEALTSLN